MHGEKCIAKYYEHVWLEIEWEGSCVYMEHIEGHAGHADRIKTPHNEKIFTPALELVWD